MKRVDGKVALVTGAAVGIGRATAAILAREGAAVAVTDVLDEEGADAVRDVDEAGGIARFWHMDVADDTEVARVVGEVAEAFGGLDILVNNAGIAGTDAPTHELDDDDWNRVLAVNVMGVFHCTKHAVPLMRKRGGGSIVNLSSIYGLVGAPDAPPYHASKGAVRLMTKTDALLYADDGIRVNSVHPGFIRTPMVEGYLESSGDDPAEARRALTELHPLGRLGEAAEVARGILYLASEESSFVTGSELIIDGGYTAR